MPFQFPTGWVLGSSVFVKISEIAIKAAEPEEALALHPGQDGLKQQLQSICSCFLD